ncbi:hypothetical protein QQM79_06565 [Marinobacteraceae bacterium S3BR75-40.1]
MILFEKAAEQHHVERNGQLTYRPDQLFNLHRLNLVVMGTCGRRFRYGSVEDLEQLLAFAEGQDNAAVTEQLKAVRAVLPYRITSGAMAAAV